MLTITLSTFFQISLDWAQVQELKAWHVRQNSFLALVVHKV